MYPSIRFIIVCRRSEEDHQLRKEGFFHKESNFVNEKGFLFHKKGHNFGQEDYLQAGLGRHQSFFFIKQVIFHQEVKHLKSEDVVQANIYTRSVNEQEDFFHITEVIDINTQDHC